MYLQEVVNLLSVPRLWRGLEQIAVTSKFEWEDEMRRHQAEMNLLFEEVRHVSYAAVGWQYVT